MTVEGFYRDEKMGRNIYIPLNKFMGIFAVFEFEFEFYTAWRKTNTVLRA
jgi:hypothetical protein